MSVRVFIRARGGGLCRPCFRKKPAKGFLRRVSGKKRGLSRMLRAKVIKKAFPPVSRGYRGAEIGKGERRAGKGKGNRAFDSGFRKAGFRRGSVFKRRNGMPAERQVRGGRAQARPIRKEPASRPDRKFPLLSRPSGGPRPGTKFRRLQEASSAAGIFAGNTGRGCAGRPMRRSCSRQGSRIRRLRQAKGKRSLRPFRPTKRSLGTRRDRKSRPRRLRPSR